MKLFLLSIFFVGFVLVVSCSEQAFAYTVNFPVNNHRVTGIPTYCGMQPNPDLISPELSKYWMQEAEISVTDWKTMLGNANSEHRDRWEMNYVTIPYGQNSDVSKCDIQINFQDKPKPEDSFSYLGYLQNNIIKVFYLEIGTCEDQGITSQCYKENAIRTPPSLGSTVRHEIGHTLGLGHYTADDNKVNLAWYSGTEEIPSIMVPAPENPVLRTIKDVDIQKVMQIYGPFGFLAFSKDSQQRSQLEVTGSIVSISSIDSFTISNQIITIKQYQPQLEKFYGKVSGELYKKGQKVFIIITKPDFSPEVLSVNPSNQGTFEIPHVFDKNAQKGQYFVEISYMGYVDNAKSISFEVEDENSQSRQIVSTKQITQKQIQIPTWLKNNARSWSQGNLDDKNFMNNLRYLVSQDVIIIPQQQTVRIEKIPSWMKTNAGWWSENSISDKEFVLELQYLVSNGFLKIKS